MKKLLKWHDTYTVKLLVCFLILFTALYPKLPSVHIIRTWVYIRLEDFAIFFTVFVWLIQLIRKKVAVPLALASPVIFYWIVGLISVIVSILFIGPHLVNFFPHIALLNYVRRIEYMILFFVAISTVKSTRDLRDYFIILSITIVGILFYGIGQKYYLDLWAKYPVFFEKNPFCFPSFQTGNEEFAKGIPLCLPKGARIPSTFGGHYDLAAYLVFVIPIVMAVAITIKKWYLRVLTWLLFIGGLVLMMLTASRTSFIAYLIGAVIALILYRKKWFILPVVIISIVVLLVFSESTAKRILATFRISSVVTNSQGQLIGESLPQDLKNKISKDSIEKPPPSQNLPEGSAFIGLPQQTTPIATDVAMIKKTLSPGEARRLQLANGSLQISTISGTFLVRKALVYDISFTTRFQSEWPNAWRAFLRNPLFGSGYSSITLATDNDYFRALGETGLLGIFSFILVFIILGITLKELVPNTKDPFTKAFAYGLAGGVIGLALNATLIDVFEASKVAENLWIFLGIGAGGLLLAKQKHVSYRKELTKIFTSNFALSLYLLFILGAAFLSNVNNFFVADDFTGLRWAASSTISDLPKYFLNSQNFFYRPLGKTIFYFLYTVFSFQPQGYHVYTLMLHFFVTIAVFTLAMKIFKKKLLGFLTALLFLLSPAHPEINFWLSTHSIILSSLFILTACAAFLKFRQNKSVVSYLWVFVLSVLAFLSYEQAVVLSLLFITLDIFIAKPKRSLRTALTYVPFFALLPVYYVIRLLTHAFSGGGDYSYSLPHLLPNIIGNFFGYLGLFIGGEKFLPLYDVLRGNLRANVFLFAIILLLIILIVFILGYSYRHTLAKYAKTSNGQLIQFGVVFSFVTLLPFLALGNIADRYIYLAVFGLCIALVALLNSIVEVFRQTAQRKDLLLIIIVVIIVSVYQLNNVQVNKNWEQAGKTTQATLLFFRTEYDGFPPSTSLYFVNTPVKQKGAWVFPVGLYDGLWFIYREGTPTVHQVESVDQANTATQHSKEKKFIFKFDNKGNISKVSE